MRQVVFEPLPRFVNWLLWLIGKLTATCRGKD